MAALPEISPKWSKPRDLTGENVLITGASGGLGLAVAKQIAEHGGNLIWQLEMFARRRLWPNNFQLLHAEVLMSLN